MRIAVLSDIHANLVALDAVITSFERIDSVWHLGDVVGYGPDPDGVIERLQGVDAKGVRGNHDAAAIGGSEIDWFNPVARIAMEWTRAAIGPASRAWLADLPATYVDGDFTLVHGSPRDPTWEYVMTADTARDNFAALTTVHGLNGHTHRPLAFVAVGSRVETRVPRGGETLDLDGGRALLNPGSVGQPRDGSPDSSYLVIDTSVGTCTWHRIAYDVAQVQAAMRGHGLPRVLVDRLAVGT